MGSIPLVFDGGLHAFLEESAAKILSDMANGHITLVMKYAFFVNVSECVPANIAQ
jgi:hypothetical protein